MEEQNYNTAIKLMSHIKKYVKKYPITGMVEREQWFQFNYRVTGVKFNDDRWSWNRVLYVNVEVSDKYWLQSTQEWRHVKYFMWSSRRRNQYIRAFVKDEVKQFFDIFSFPYRVEIKTIKMVKP
jgi:hypothetical protein